MTLCRLITTDPYVRCPNLDYFRLATIRDLSRGGFYYRAFTAEEKSLLPVKLATLGISIRALRLANVSGAFLDRTLGSTSNTLALMRPGVIRLSVVPGAEGSNTITEEYA